MIRKESIKVGSILLITRDDLIGLAGCGFVDKVDPEGDLEIISIRVADVTDKTSLVASVGAPMLAKVHVDTHKLAMVSSFEVFEAESKMEPGIKHDTAATVEEMHDTATAASVPASLNESQVKTESEKSDADRFKEITDKMSDTYKRKNHDYGNAFSEIYDELGINYGYGKIREKVNRINTLKDNEAQVANEPLEDALLDCANYCILR